MAQATGPGLYIGLKETRGHVALPSLAKKNYALVNFARVLRSAVSTRTSFVAPRCRYNHWTHERALNIVIKAFLAETLYGLNTSRKDRGATR